MSERWTEMVVFTLITGIAVAAGCWPGPKPARGMINANRVQHPVLFEQPLSTQRRLARRSVIGKMKCNSP